MNQAYWVTEITVEDPESKAPVELSVYKHQNGGMFAVDSSFIEQTLDEDEPIQDPLENKGRVMLIELPDEIKP